MANELERDLGLPGSEVPQRVRDAFQMGTWINSLAPWQVFATFTWRDKVFLYRDGSPKACGVSLDSARRGYESFMAKQLPYVSYFYAIEPNPSRDGHHVHAIWADCLTVRRKAIFEEWLKKNGRNRIEPVRGLGSVVDYAAKYLTIANVWWNVKLQWHRRQALNNATYTLTGETVAKPQGLTCQVNQENSSGTASASNV